MYNYVVAKRQSFSRFYFLSDQLLSQFLCIQISEQFMSQALQILQKVSNAIFANTAQIQFESAVGDDGITKYFLTQVVSHEGEHLGIKPISTRQLVEVWISQKLSYEQQSLRQ